MDTTEVLPISHYTKLNPFPHLEFMYGYDDNQVIAVSKCPVAGNSGDEVWAFTIPSGYGPKAFKFSRSDGNDYFHPCANPVDYASGAALIQALHPWKSWQLFLDQVKMPELYTGHLIFYLEYEPEKAECMEIVKPNASKGLVVATVNDTAKPSGKNDFTVQAYLSIPNALGHEPPNNPNIIFERMSCKWIEKVTTRIDEKTARIIHPALFEHLDEHLAPQLSTKPR